MTCAGTIRICGGFCPNPSTPRSRFRRGRSSSAGAYVTASRSIAFSYPLIFLPFFSAAFVPTGTMPGPVRAFAEHQPATSIVNTIRDLYAQQPIGTETSPWSPTAARSHKLSKVDMADSARLSTDDCMHVFGHGGRRSREQTGGTFAGSHRRMRSWTDVSPMASGWGFPA